MSFFYVFVKSVFKKILYNPSLRLKIFSNNHCSRDEFDIAVKNFKRLNRDERLPISVVYRVKDGEDYLALSIASIADFVKEIILVDNGSSDNTKYIFDKAKKIYTDVKFVYEYHGERYAKAGDSYKEDKNKGLKGLSEYYSYAFGMASSEYVMKMDAHYILLPIAIKKIRNKISKKNPIIKLKIIDIYGRGHGYEPLLFKNEGFYFVEGDSFELIKFKYKYGFIDKVKSMTFGNSILHVKRLMY